MAGRRKETSDDEGPAGKDTLAGLLKETLEVTVRNGQPNITIKLLDYANAKAPRAASAAIGAAAVANALGPENATPEVVAYLLGCRTRQILPAIEDYFKQKKGTKKGDMD